MPTDELEGFCHSCVQPLPDPPVAAPSRRPRIFCSEECRAKAVVVARYEAEGASIQGNHERELKLRAEADAAEADAPDYR